MTTTDEMIEWLDDAINDEQTADVGIAVAARDFIAANSWQPIETAPMDGTFILLRGGKVREDCSDTFTKKEAKRSVVAKYDTSTSYWVVSGFDSFCTIEYHKPTHWMPLPAAPQPEEGI